MKIKCKKKDPIIIFVDPKGVKAWDKNRTYHKGMEVYRCTLLALNISVFFHPSRQTLHITLLGMFCYGAELKKYSTHHYYTTNDVPSYFGRHLKYS